MRKRRGVWGMEKREKTHFVLKVRVSVSLPRNTHIAST